MMTYLKNMGGYKHSYLKAKTFAEIQSLYERQKRVIDDFKPMDLDDAVKDSKEAAGVHKQKVLEEPNSTKVEIKKEGHEESIRKRPSRRLKMKATKKFETTTPEGVDLVLWGDLRIMFNANAEDELSQNQKRWNLNSCGFYGNLWCSITLILEDGTEIHMLAERKYPLTKENIE
ncbi:hypothetical protein Tco_0708625 [Tanacetum coccineum]